MTAMLGRQPGRHRRLRGARRHRGIGPLSANPGPRGQRSATDTDGAAGVKAPSARSTERGPDGQCNGVAAMPAHNKASIHKGRMRASRQTEGSNQKAPQGIRTIRSASPVLYGQRHEPGPQPFGTPPGQLFGWGACACWRGGVCCDVCALADAFFAHAASTENCITAKAPATATTENTL